MASVMGLLQKRYSAELQDSPPRPPWGLRDLWPRETLTHMLAGGSYYSCVPGDPGSQGRTWQCRSLASVWEQIYFTKCQRKKAGEEGKSLPQIPKGKWSEGQKEEKRCQPNTSNSPSLVEKGPAASMSPLPSVSPEQTLSASWHAAQWLLRETLRTTDAIRSV